MAEIHLPTKGTQDAIKAETDKIQSIKNDMDFIKGGFPLSGGVKSVQRGVRTSAVGLSTVNITAINRNKSFLIVENHSIPTNDDTPMEGFVVVGNIKSNSQIELFSNVDGTRIYWQVVEFE